MNFNEYIKDIKKVDSKRNHKFKNSIGLTDYYKYLLKNNLNEGLTLKLVSSIIKDINRELAIGLELSKEINLPHRLGIIELRKFKPYVSQLSDLIKIHRPVDWLKTLQLWYEDSLAKNDKLLIYSDAKWIYKIYYNKLKCNYTNKSFITLSPNRQLKVKIKQLINDNKLDAYTL